MIPTKDSKSSCTIPNCSVCAYMTIDDFHETRPPYIEHWEEEPWECINCGSQDMNHILYGKGSCENY